MLKVLAAAAMGVATPALAGDPAGGYGVVGSPGSSHHYSGSVTVDRTGDTHHVVWPPERYS